MNNRTPRSLFGFVRDAPDWIYVCLALSLYGLVTAAVLASLVLQMRADALTAGQEILSAFAQLTEEQTTRTFQNIDLVLQKEDATVAATAGTNSTKEDEIQAEFLELTRALPFLRALSVTDSHGRVIHTSAQGSVGVDLSDREYFVRHRDNLGGQFQIGIPVRARSSGEWLLPASRARRSAGGEFAGVIVASLNPEFFNRVWTVHLTLQDQATALWNDEGVMLMRSPTDERAMGVALRNGEVFTRIRQQSSVGSFRTVSLVDGQDRIVAYRQLTAYPGLMLTVTRTTTGLLAPWRHIAWIVGASWIASLLVFGGLSVWLLREWRDRRATQSRYRLLFDSNPFPMAVVERDSRRILAVNEAAIAEYGWSRSEFRQLTSDDFYTLQELPTVKALRQRDDYTLREIENNTLTIPGLQHRRKDGTIFDVDQTARMIQFGDQPAMVVMVQNISERSRAARLLQESEEKYRSLFDSMPVGLLEATIDGRVVAANASWRRMFGFGEAEDLSTVSVGALYAEPNDRDAIVAAARSTVTATQETTYRRPDGTTFEAESHARGLFDSTGRIVGLMGVIIDISKRKSLELQLQQAQKLDAVGKLTGGIAHDFNNILMVITANVEAVLEDDGATIDPKLHLQRIGGATERATQLTRQLLAFSRKQTLRLQPINLNELVVTTGALLRRTLGAHIKIDSLLADQLWQINTDRAQIEAALLNLCINARDAMPTGGRLLVETRNATLDADYVLQNPEATPGDYVLLSVTDTGTGISPEVLSKVFEPFFTTKETGKGTGLGLSMVYGFVKQSKGHITIYSEVGHGTAVKLYLPRSKSLEAGEAPNAPISSPRGTERILLVEDEEQVRVVVADHLTGLGYDVVVAANGPEALAMVRSERAFDLMLTDIIMPGQINGKALADEATALSPSMRMLFMSGYSEDAISTFRILNRGVTLLSKPFRKVDLATAVRRVLDSSY